MLRLDPELITVMSKTTGMYADTNTYSRSAKVRLGKRKVEFDLVIQYLVFVYQLCVRSR